MTDEELSAIEALANAATQGPWEVIPDPDKPYLDRVVRHYGHLTDLLAQCFHANGNAAFIAACRDAVPALIAEVRRLRELIMLVARSQREPWDMVLFDEAYDAVTEVEKTWTTTTS